MKQKDRLFKAVVIGATPAGIAAANKMGELGVPVTLVDAMPDLDRKLAADAYVLKSGVPFNYAHRPGLLRLLRNPRVGCQMPAAVADVKRNPQGFRVKIRKAPAYVDPEQCVLCGKCVESCPVTLANGRKPIYFESRRSLPGRPVIDKRRTPLCQAECPLGVNVQGYMALTRAGKYAEAYALIRKDNVLPGICGRICTHPCEIACRRKDLDEPLAIRDIKRFVSDYVRKHPLPENQEPAGPARNERIAVIGSGPAGLAAAAELAALGYPVTVMEREDEIGGLLRYGIGHHRLPRDILDEEIDAIRRMGVTFVTGRGVDFENDLPELAKDFAAVILAGGTWHDRPLGMPGEDLEGVEGCISFLTRYYRGRAESVKGKHAAVIGDGNAAFDLARTLKRVGASVTLLSWFPMDMIPADPHEIKGAEEEGVKIIDNTRVVEFLGENGRMNRLVCRTTKPGKPGPDGIAWPVTVKDAKPFEMAFDLAFVAIGQTGDLHASDACGFERNEAGLICADAMGRTAMKNVFAAGDAVTGPKAVVHAMAGGRNIARSVLRFLAGNKQDADVMTADRSARPAERDFDPIPDDIPSLARPVVPEMQPAVRCNTFDEVALGFDPQQALFEAGRCLQCGICSECRQCITECGAIHAIDHGEAETDIIEHAGVVIIADPDMAPAIRGEDVIRAYGPATAQVDVYAMMLRGYAAAAQAMTLLKGMHQRQKGHGTSFSPPDPGLSPEIRIGVIACRCNDSFGWTDAMTDFVGGLTRESDIVFSDVVDSACTPEGIAAILRAVREKEITRLVLASCVCCPLNFVCSSCTYSRSRLKDGLFNGTGISRSMVQPYNMRGEVLSFLERDPDLAFKRFTGMMNRSVSRSRNLKPFPSPARNYNFTTAVIGCSEASLEAAATLADFGLEVFLFGVAGESCGQEGLHPNIHYFKNAVVKGISGTLGNFQVMAVEGDNHRTLQAGAVILSEKGRKTIDYIRQEELPGHRIASSLQEAGVDGIPFQYPGMTAISGLFLAEPPGIRVSARRKGAAVAVLAAAVMPRGPRQNKGYMVVVREDICRGCGRCIGVCPFEAIDMTRNSLGGWHAVIDEALCKGCGNCISVCPSNAAESPYRDLAFLEQTIAELMDAPTVV